ASRRRSGAGVGPVVVHAMARDRLRAARQARVRPVGRGDRGWGGEFCPSYSSPPLCIYGIADRDGKKGPPPLRAAPVRALAKLLASISDHICPTESPTLSAIH